MNLATKTGLAVCLFLLKRTFWGIKRFLLWMSSGVYKLSCWCCCNSPKNQHMHAAFEIKWHQNRDREKHIHSRYSFEGGGGDSFSFKRGMKDSVWNIMKCSSMFLSSSYFLFFSVHLFLPLPLCLSFYVSLFYFLSQYTISSAFHSLLLPFLFFLRYCLLFLSLSLSLFVSFSVSHNL